MSQKKFFIIITVVLLILIVGLIGYYFVITSGGSSTTSPTSVFKQFFPFGQNTSSATSTQTQQTEQTPSQNQSYALKLRKIWSDPVAGAGILDTKAGTTVRHVEVATGYVYETELFSPNQNRISNVTMPLIYNAVWGNGNKSFIAQYLKGDNQSISTYSMSIKYGATTTEKAISGNALVSGISSVSVLGNNMFYLQISGTGSKGFIGAMDGQKMKQIWSSPLKEFIPQLVNSATVALTTKPYPYVSGFLYTANTSTGSVKKILGDVPGLSDLVSPDASEVLYLSQTDSAQMFLYNTKDHSSAALTPATFPEKCVWSKKISTVLYCAVPRENLDGGSLTSWYMGTVSFTDDIWKYDLKQNTSAIVGNLSDESGESIDVIKPLLSDGEQYIVFINKRDGSLWSLDLSK